MLVQVDQRTQRDLIVLLELVLHNGPDSSAAKCFLIFISSTLNVSVSCCCECVLFFLHTRGSAEEALVS